MDDWDRQRGLSPDAERRSPTTTGNASGRREPRRLCQGGQGLLPLLVRQLVDVVLVLHFVAGPIARPETDRLVVAACGKDVPERVPVHVPHRPIVPACDFSLGTSGQ